MNDNRKVKKVERTPEQRKKQAQNDIKALFSKKQKLSPARKYIKSLLDRENKD